MSILFQLKPSQPADVVKTQMQLGKQRKISSALASIYRQVLNNPT